MRKGKRLIDRPILSLADGVRVGAVKDVILGPENDQVIGLLTDEGGLLSSAHFVPLGEVQSFGKDAIVVRSTDSVLPADRAPDIKAHPRSQAVPARDSSVFTRPATSRARSMTSTSTSRSGRVTAMGYFGRSR